jgi:uncharacterized protein YabE (DUF348 family)
MNLNDFSDKQKALILVFGLVVLLLIFTLSMASLSSKNSALKVRLEQEKVVTLSLFNTSENGIEKPLNTI